MTQMQRLLDMIEQRIKVFEYLAQTPEEEAKPNEPELLQERIKELKWVTSVIKYILPNYSTRIVENDKGYVSGNV